MRVRITIVSGLLVVFLSRCSTLHVTMNPPDDVEGIRTYGSAPYLQVTAPIVVEVISSELLSFDNQKQTFEVVPLPKKASRIEQQPGAEPASTWSSGQLKPEFQLVSLTGLADNPEKSPKAKTSNSPKIGGSDIPDDKADNKADTPGQSDSGKSAAGPFSIVYLPDGCREFAIAQSNFLSSASLGLTLKDGWQLATLQSSGDTTAVIKSIIDGAAAVLGTAKGGGGGGGGGSKEQGLGTLYVRLKTRVLKPGLYPLMTRTGGSKDHPCSGRLTFASPFATTSGNTYVAEDLILLPAK